MNEAVANVAVTYGEAWARHDPSAIAAMHTSDSVFHLHDIAPPYVGLQAIHAAAAEFFAHSPDLRFERVRVHFGDDHFVTEYAMLGTRAGRAFRCEGTDVFSVRNGLIARKDSYIDWLTYQQQTGVEVAAAIVGGRLLSPPAS